MSVTRYLAACIPKEECELILWGLPKGETDPIHQKVLYTKAKNMKQIDSIKEIAAKDGWHSFKVQKLDPTSLRVFGI